MAAGRAVVSTDLPSIREIVDKDRGVLVPPGDPAALADAIAGLLEDDARREAMGRAGHRKVQTRYAWPHLAAQLEVVYNEVLFGT